MIELKNVTKIIDENKVVDNVSLNLEKGKIYGLIGTNGSGKSMILRLICGLIYPTSGKIYIDNKLLDRKNLNLNNIGALIERPKFLNNISGFENLKMLADINKKIDSKEIDDYLKYADLYDDRNKLYKKYSLGMKQKLGIIQAIMENQEIIILDEPFNGIDENSSKKIRELLLKKKNEGKTIVIATHIKDDINLLCDEIYKIDAGKVVDIIK